MNTIIKQINSMCRGDLQRLSSCIEWYSKNVDDGMEIQEDGI